MTFKPVAIPYMTCSLEYAYRRRGPGTHGLDTYAPHKGTYAPHKGADVGVTTNEYPFNGSLDASFILGGDPLFVVRDEYSERTGGGKLLIICTENIESAQNYSKCCLTRPNNCIANPLTASMAKDFLAEKDEDYPEISSGSLVIELTRNVNRDRYGRMPLSCFYATRELLGQFTSFCRLLAKGIKGRPNDEILTVSKLVEGCTRPTTLNDGTEALKYIPSLDKR